MIEKEEQLTTRYGLDKVYPNLKTTVWLCLH